MRSGPAYKAGPVRVASALLRNLLAGSPARGVLDFNRTPRDWS